VFVDRDKKERRGGRAFFSILCGRYGLSVKGFNASPMGLNDED
jgi:hypothetical protein